MLWFSTNTSMSPDPVRAPEPNALPDLVLPTVVATLRRLSRVWRGPDFDDLVQIALERVVRTIASGQFRGECSLKAWAASIAANAAIDFHRARQRERRLFPEGEEPCDIESMPATNLGAEQALIARIDAARLQGILGTLEPLDAEIVVLLGAMGFTAGEVARDLGRSQAAIESRMARARARVRQRMQGASGRLG
jgi:RNA polymerase sigma-70 factor (ECF subfamily)